MMLTRPQLLRAVPELYRPRLNEFVAYWNQWAIPFGIDTPLRTAHCLAQLFHESGNLKYCEENLNYSAKGLLSTFPNYFNEEQAAHYAHHPVMIANKVYAGRMGNGNVISGDGWKYRGRGYIQTTGKKNYEKYKDSEFCIGNPVNNPDMLLKAPDNLKSAFYFWSSNGCNELADKDDCDTITKRINGGLNGISNRKFLLRRFKKELMV